MTGIDSRLQLPPVFTDTTSPVAANINQSPEAAGQQFEGLFWSLLIKTMRTTVSDGGLFAGDKSDTYGGMFDLFMSQHLADSGSLGIGEIVESWYGNSQSAESQEGGKTDDQS